ncbi:hypothetical protein V1Y59_02585 [Gordonia sp. PKS22-38]|uniref:Uncharacterized protein n=1 Tax=Gordonia prachuapensis TaxID=3115651 RepID=A0ABU7MNQ6_9ACTN|nr:hypothetical protein [Gordonia sp. PKS22-38]
MAVSTPIRRARQVLVWLHVLSSVSWMSQALAMMVLLLQHNSADSAAAHLLDTTVLVVSANASAATGFLLCATTSWGYFHHWWVAVKFGITVVQLFVGIAILSPALNSAGGSPPPQLITGTVIMASLIAFQGWLSIGKPWGRMWFRVRGGSPGRAPMPPTGVIVVAPAAVLGDVAIFVVVGQPIPICSLVALVIALVTRRDRHTGRSRRPAAAADIARAQASGGAS